MAKFSDGLVVKSFYLTTKVEHLTSCRMNLKIDISALRVFTKGLSTQPKGRAGFRNRVPP